MLATTEIAAVLAQYELGALHEAVPASHGGVNETAIITTSRGRFVLRRNHRRISAAAQRYRHLLMEWVRRHGVPTPALIPARSGSTLCLIAGRSYEIQQHITGGDVDPSRPQQLDSIGATLARYHEAVRGFPPPPKAAGPRYCPDRLAGLSEQLLERDVLGELHEALACYDRATAYLRAQLPASTYAALPQLVIHGDVHLDNVLVRGDAVAALLDYDQVSWDARLVDVADALVAFATAQPSDPFADWGVYRGPLDEQRATRLIATYTSVAALSATELALLPAMVEVLWLAGELGRVISTPEGSPDYHLAVLEQGRRLSAWMHTHGPPLAQNWAAIAARQPPAPPSEGAE
jgi:homoserine kinase type II